MSDLIDRQMAIDTISRFITQFSDTNTAVRLQTAINRLPSAVRRGKWIWNENGMDWGLGAWVCSECGSKAETWWAADKRNNPFRCAGGHYCGDCGAKMGGEDGV